MSPKSWRWLGPPHERQHVFVEDRNRTLCQMVQKTPECVRLPDNLTCFWCKRRLRYLVEHHRLEPTEKA